MRIAVGGIEHESSSFTPVTTRLDDFLAEGHFVDTEALAQRRGDANTIVDGFLTGLRAFGATIVPLIWSDAPSGGLATMETYQHMKERLLDPLRRAVPVDGVLLSLHGSFSVQGIDDADGDLLKEVRALVGNDCPIISVHDLHCNISDLMVQSATAMLVERTYPHTDMAERGAAAAELMVRTVRKEARPVMAWRSLPLFWAAAKGITSEEPMRTAMQQLVTMDEDPRVLTASIGVGFQWADVSCAGASVIVVTDNDRADAQTRADALAGWIWDRRSLWQQTPLSPADALSAGEERGRYPIILADQADNTGGGAPGDSTEILRLFIDRKLRDAAVLYMVDAETVRRARRAGVGGYIDVAVGGTSGPLSGPPVPMHAQVCALTDGRFVYDGPMYANKEGYVGDSALLRQEGLLVVVITNRGQPIDVALPRTLGLDCTQLRYISVKSAGHFRSGYGAIAGSIFNVDAQGALSHDVRALPFKRLGRKVYPIDPELTWHA